MKTLLALSGKNKKSDEARFSYKNGAPETIRTSDLWLRRPTLYPTELRAHGHDFTVVTTVSPLSIVLTYFLIVLNWLCRVIFALLHSYSGLANLNRHQEVRR